MDFPIYQYPATSPTVVAGSSAASLIVSILMTVVLPYVLYLAQQYVDTHIKDQRLKQWAGGAVSAAGKAYAMLPKLRQDNPTAPFDQLLEHAVMETAKDLMSSYSQTAAKLGATEADAKSRVSGELGAMLAADPRFPLLTTPTRP